MRLTLVNHQCVTYGPLHHAFTDICYWRDQWYCAYRAAPTHDIVPPGCIEVLTSPHGRSWHVEDVIRHPIGDVRDPRFCTTKDILWMLIGVYLPRPGHAELSNHSAENVIQTHLTYTTTGVEWAPLLPIMRPQYWGWSALQTRAGYYVAAYHTGTTLETSSITLCSSTTLLSPLPHAVMYDGASLQQEDEQWRWYHRHTAPCEPVLYKPAQDVLACALRTEKGMEIGVAHYRSQYQDWRWHDTELMIHPSAVYATKHGTLLAGRTITPRYRRGKLARYERSADLYALHGHDVTHLLTLPSDQDCGYCGVCQGPEEDTVLVSWYSQHETPHGLPAASVYVATVKVEG